MKRKLQFIPNVARKPQGLSHPGIEQFRDNPYIACARETGQNSRDAAELGGAPVRMQFNLKAVSRDDVPFADELSSALRACKEQSIETCVKHGKDPEKDRTISFFRLASDLIDESEIKILEIADYNTTGLTGPFDDDDSIFNSLVKADGVTNKQQSDSGGSFGIGKNAGFAVSDVQTIVYSTRSRNLDEPEADDLYACQARAQLISHEVNDELNSAEGYWGREDFYAIEDTEGLPDWMIRQDRGTSIFAMCFRQHESWAERMTLSIITNFMLAIHRGEMEFEIDDGNHKINKSTLPSLLENPILSEVAESANLSVVLERSKCLYDCITNGAAKTEEITVDGYGTAYLHILVAEGMPRSVNILRNGMYITSNLKNFGFPLTSFPGTREFVAILEPAQGEAGRPLSELLKRLENPEHDSFSPERLRNDDERKSVLSVFRKLHKDVRDLIRSQAKVEQSDSSNIDELARLFSSDPNDGDSNEGAEKDPERYIMGKATQKKAAPPQKQGGKQGGGMRGGGGVRKGKGKGKKKGFSRRGKKGKGRLEDVKSFSISHLRSRREPTGGEYSHTVFFTPEESGVATISIEAAGLTSAASLEISGSDGGVIESGAIKIELVAGERKGIGVNFAENYEGPIEISSTVAES